MSTMMIAHPIRIAPAKSSIGAPRRMFSGGQKCVQSKPVQVNRRRFVPKADTPEGGSYGHAAKGDFDEFNKIEEEREGAYRA